MKEKIKSVFSAAGICFTAISFILTLLYAFFLENSETRSTTNVTWQEYAKLLTCILAFSFMLGIANLVLSAKKIPVFARRTIHFLIIILSSFLLLVLATGKLSDAKQTLFILVATAVIYLISWAVGAVFRAVGAGVKASHSEYDSILKGK